MVRDKDSSLLLVVGLRNNQEDRHKHWDKLAWTVHFHLLQSTRPVSKRSFIVPHIVVAALTRSAQSNCCYSYVLRAGLPPKERTFRKTVLSRAQFLTVWEKKNLVKIKLELTTISLFRKSPYLALKRFRIMFRILKWATCEKYVITPNFVFWF